MGREAEGVLVRVGLGVAAEARARGVTSAGVGAMVAAASLGAGPQ